MPYGSASVDTLLTSTGQVFSPASSSATMKNRIINGAMVIDQRNAGASVTLNDGVFPVDRFRGICTQSSKMTAQQSSTVPAGFKNSLAITSSSAYSVGSGDTFSIQQRIEGLNVSDLGWGAVGAQTVTLSFWVRSSLTGTFGGALLNSDNTRSYPYSYTISSANTWEQKSITIAGDTSGTWLTTNGIGIKVGFGLGSGSTYSGTANTWAGAEYYQPTGSTSVVGTNGATFYITGVQLEVGSTASSFDYRPYGTELALCQRYYETNFPQGTAPTNGIQLPDRIPGVGYASNSIGVSVCFRVEKRATPSFVLYAGSNNNTAGKWCWYNGSWNAVTGYNINFPSTNATAIDFVTSGSSTTSYILQGGWTASAEL